MVILNETAYYLAIVVGGYGASPVQWLVKHVYDCEEVSAIAVCRTSCRSRSSGKVLSGCRLTDVVFVLSTQTLRRDC